MPQTREQVDPNRIPAFPARETGVQDGNGMVVCKTCHQGVLKPLQGREHGQRLPRPGRPRNGEGDRRATTHPAVEGELAMFRNVTQYMDLPQLAFWLFFLAFVAICYFPSQERQA